MSRKKKGVAPSDATAPEGAPVDAASSTASAGGKGSRNGKGRGAGKDGKKRKVGEKRTKTMTGKQQIELAEKRREALDYRRQGYTYAEIAEAMGVSATTAWGYVSEEIKAIPQEVAEDVRNIELERLDFLQSRIWSQFMDTPNLGLAEGIMKIMDRRARYLGLYKSEDHGLADRAFRAMGERMSEMMKADAPVLRPDGPIPASPIL